MSPGPAGLGPELARIVERALSDRGARTGVGDRPGRAVEPVIKSSIKARFIQTAVIAEATPAALATSLASWFETAGEIDFIAALPLGSTAVISSADVITTEWAVLILYTE